MATFTVTNTNNSGAGSLRQEILDANALTGKNIVNFSGLFNDGLAHTISLTSSGLSITDNLTIEGTNPNLLTIKDDSGTRVFDIASGATATINGLTITNSYKGTGGGGAISNEGVFTLNNSIITGNTTESGSTIYGFGDNSGYGGGIYNDGTLTVNYSTLNNNTAESGSSNFADGEGGGGGIYNNFGGTLTVNYSTLNNNTAEAGNSYESGGGGGIYDDGILTVNYSTLSNNKTGTNSDYYSGGGIYSHSGKLVVNNSNITGNTTSGSGGGIVSSSCVLNNSNITDNTAAYGGGIALGTASDTFSYNGTFTLNYSNITSNSATSDGGGIYNRGETLLVSKSTITGNSATSDGGGIDGINGYFHGGGPSGFFAPPMLILGNINVSNSTISDNQAHFGAGIYNDGNLTVGNSTIKHNKAFGIKLSSNNYKSGEGGGIYHNSTDYASTAALIVPSNFARLDYSTVASNFDTPQEDSTKFIKLDNLVGKFINKGSLVGV
ncbi:hypothetical protein [Nostoc sp.]|uniref:hypothetical protein n=1 Tax=Nostoc sp. TaxID=1180 RepID=UPI002FF954DB